MRLCGVCVVYYPVVYLPVILKNFFGNQLVYKLPLPVVCAKSGNDTTSRERGYKKWSFFSKNTSKMQAKE